MTEVVADFATALAAALPGRVVTDRDAMEAYRRDQCLLAPAGRPAAVVRARSTDDVITTLLTAGDHHAPVVTRGPAPGWPARPMRSTAASCSRSPRWTGSSPWTCLAARQRSSRAC